MTRICKNFIVYSLTNRLHSLKICIPIYINILPYQKLTEVAFYVFSGISTVDRIYDPSNVKDSYG